MAPEERETTPMVVGSRKRKGGVTKSGVPKRFGHDFYQQGRKQPGHAAKYYANNAAQLRTDHPR